MRRTFFREAAFVLLLTISVLLLTLATACGSVTVASPTVIRQAASAPAPAPRRGSNAAYVIYYSFSV
ncbi:MAG TPA: hypothetical protein VGG76_05210 [Gemmatimonadaceae bacterium]